MLSYITLNNVALALMVCVAPAVVWFMIFRGAPPPTVAEILNEADRRI
jgi:hypothetical protein